jgi:hypothetical protein
MLLWRFSGMAAKASSAGHSHELKAGEKRLPVTVITGFLGSGKTTLLSVRLNPLIALAVLLVPVPDPAR